jgi:hypothetical protein
VHARGSLENIGGEGAAIDVELNAEIAGVADPGDLIAGIEDNDFGEYTNKNGAFGHAEEFTVNGRKLKVLWANSIRLTQEYGTGGLTCTTVRLTHLVGVRRLIVVLRGAKIRLGFALAP